MDTASLILPSTLEVRSGRAGKEGEEVGGDWGRLSLQLISYLARRKRKLLSRLGLFLHHSPWPCCGLQLLVPVVGSFGTNTTRLEE